LTAGRRRIASPGKGDARGACRTPARIDPGAAPASPPCQRPDAVGELGVSLRTIYRDVQILICLGASIDGEAGVGYVLRPGYVLPPLMFSDEEIEALVLGSRWVAQRTDGPLAHAAANAIAKIAAVLPDDLREGMESNGLLAGPGSEPESEPIDLTPIRRAIRAERKLVLQYMDAKGDRSRRTVWPIALGFFDRSRVLAAWCELRQDYRHFRTDRIVTLRATDKRYPRRRRALLKEWREIEGIPEQI
jgi:predicted DNA-binding transcriptional regulator YafY